MSAIFFCRRSISSLASLTATEYWKQREETLAEISIAAKMPAAAERPSIRPSGRDRVSGFLVIKQFGDNQGGTIEPCCKRDACASSA